MDDLTAFLAARFDEDERIARDAAEVSQETLLGLYTDLIKAREFDDQRRAYGIHLSHITPERTLWEVDSRRRILAEVNRMLPPNLDVDCGQTTVLKALALPYASHHEFRKEWLPRTEPHAVSKGTGRG